MEPTLARLLEDTARRLPDAPALVAGDQSWSFRQLLAATAERAAMAPVGPTWRAEGSNLDRALAAYAASHAGRIFHPVAPARPMSFPEFLLAPDTALVIHTSGSEGQPKAVPLSHGQLAAAAAASNAVLPLGPGDEWLDCLPLSHIGGLSILWRCALGGAAVRLHEGFAPQQIARDLAGGSITHLSLVPAMLARLLEEGILPPPSLRCVLIGGAALSGDLHGKATAAGWPLYPSYGMSETAAQFATHTPADCPWREGLVGQALPGNEIAIGPDGRIRVRGPQVFAGTPQQPLEDGWLVTSDLGTLDDQGRLTVLGRADDVLISGGHKVHPLEIESRLAACPGVADVAVTGLPDPAWGQRIVALVVGDGNAEEWSRWAARHLPSVLRPRTFVALDRLPRNGMGKLERQRLQSLAEGRPS